LLCYDKQDIVNKAKEIGTYEISIKPPSYCRLVPKNPATKSSIGIIEEEESRINVRKLLNIELKCLRTIKF
ncbi:MAG: tRNA 4-thiouridine(8) synthase ThiI, partial [Candidatus Woesearchaeota archaeon]|nr:tRNA 4-thiouridine(8) synthase ThiI [Candidatus Woesearchaeota archaeon]